MLYEAHYWLLQVLQVLYDKDIVSEEVIIAWASEKQDADDIDKVFVKQSEPFIQVSLIPGDHTFLLLVNNPCGL